MCIQAGQLVCRKKDYIGGVVERILPTSRRAEVLWRESAYSRRAHRSTLTIARLEVVTEETLKERRRLVSEHHRIACAGYKYCAKHHRRLNGDGTCCECKGFPAMIYTHGDRTERPYDGPEIR